jgi:hypothetical protein
VGYLSEREGDTSFIEEEIRELEEGERIRHPKKRTEGIVEAEFDKNGVRVKKNKSILVFSDEASDESLEDVLDEDLEFLDLGEEEEPKEKAAPPPWIWTTGSTNPATTTTTAAVPKRVTPTLVEPSVAPVPRRVTATPVKPSAESEGNYGTTEEIQKRIDLLKVGITRLEMIGVDTANNKAKLIELERALEQSKEQGGSVKGKQSAGIGARHNNNNNNNNNPFHTKRKNPMLDRLVFALDEWKEAEKAEGRERTLLSLEEEKVWILRYLADVEISLYELSHQNEFSYTENLGSSVLQQNALNSRKEELSIRLKRVIRETERIEGE